MDIKVLLLTALTEAAHNAPKLHRKRSSKFVERIASLFREDCKGQSSVFVLSRDSGAHRKDLGVNELLYDILICHTDLVISSDKHKKLAFITNAIWQIESEFARDSRQAIYDFNKLVVGNAANKLFIGPIVNDDAAFIRTLRAPARHCNGSVFVALVTHPGDWEKKDLEVRLWKLVEDNWHLV
jgi:hypothetical protein